jgi:hypothetical protein
MRRWRSLLPPRTSWLEPRHRSVCADERRR